MLIYFYIAVFLLIYEFLLLGLFFNSNCFRETSQGYCYKYCLVEIL